MQHDHLQAALETLRELHQNPELDMRLRISAAEVIVKAIKPDAVGLPWSDTPEMVKIVLDYGDGDIIER